MRRSVVTALALILAATYAAAAPSPQQERARHGHDPEDHDKMPMDMAIRIPNLFNMILRKDPAGLGVDVDVPALLTFQLNRNRPFPATIVLHSPDNASVIPSSPQQPLTTPEGDVHKPHAQ